MRFAYFCFLDGTGKVYRLWPDRDPDCELKPNESVWLVPGTFTGDEP